MNTADITESSEMSVTHTTYTKYEVFCYRCSRFIALEMGFSKEKQRPQAYKGGQRYFSGLISLTRPWYFT